MSKVFSIAQGHLFTTVPEKVREETKLTSRNRWHAEVRARRDLSNNITDSGKTEVQREVVTCPMSHNQVARLRSEPKNQKSESSSLFYSTTPCLNSCRNFISPPPSPSLLTGSNRGKPTHCHHVRASFPRLLFLPGSFLFCHPFPSTHASVQVLPLNKNSNNKTKILFLILVSQTFFSSHL